MNLCYSVLHTSVTHTAEYTGTCDLSCHMIQCDHTCDNNTGSV